MKTLLRTLLSLSLIVWIGAEIFFPIVAAITFNTLLPDTHTAGTIVGQLLRILHGMGLVSGMVALAVLALAPAWGIYKPRAVLAPMVLRDPDDWRHGLTRSSASFPPWSATVSPLAARSTPTDATNPTTAHFNKLHHRSEFVEETILLLGLATVVLVAWAEGQSRNAGD